MSVCTFLGHCDTPEKIRYELKQALIDLIENKGVDLFLVGNNGNFDSMVVSELKLFSSVYTYINYFIVLDTMPYNKFSADEIASENLIFPDVLEKTTKRFIGDRRNRWMVEESDYVITYVWKNYGGAYKFKNLAEKKNKCVINLHKDK